MLIVTGVVTTATMPNSRRLCGRCLHREEEQEQEEEEEDGRQLCDNCGASCGRYHDDGDHDYAHQLCVVCLQRRCCRSCKRRLPDVSFNMEETCRVC